MSFGIRNTVIPPAPQVNTVDFNTIVLPGIAPKGPTQTLVVCGSDTDDSQFGKCLTGFTIPRALDTIRRSGAGKVVVVNVFDKVAHTTAVSAENATVTNQEAQSAFDPIEIDAVAATSIQTVSTGAATNDTIQSYTVAGVKVIDTPLLLTSGNVTVTAQQLVDAINAYTTTSGYSAVIGSSGAYTLSGPLSKGADINGIAPVITKTGTIVHASAVAFSGGINSLILVQNTPVSAVTAVAPFAALQVTTGAGAGDKLLSLKVGTVELLVDGEYTFTGGTATQTAQEIADEVNQFTGDTGFEILVQSSGNFTIIGLSSMGASINGVVTTIGTITGVLAIGVNGAFHDGVTGVTAVAAVTYIKDTDFTIDEYGKIKMIPAITDGKVLRLTYRKLNAGAIDADTIIGTVSGSTRTGCKLIDTCKTTLGIVPKILIIPGYNTLLAVAGEMDRISAKYRMRDIKASTTGLTLAQAIASRGPSGTLATYNISSKRSILVFPKVYTYDPKAADNTLDDASAAFAGFLAWNAAINGPQESTSNQVMPAVAGAEINLVHEWEDLSNAAETNQARVAGIASVFSDGGYKWWGAENSSYPGNTAVDQNICTIYVNDILTDSLTAFAVQYVDRNITSGSIAAFLTAANAYYSTRMVAGWIGKQSQIRYLAERNPSADLEQGKIRFTRNTFYFVGMKLIELEENMEVQLPTL